MDYTTEISVDGNATFVSVPDTVRLLIRLSAKAQNYSCAVEKINAGARDVNAALVSCGVVNLPQTREYAVEEDWVNKYDDEKRRLVGYEGVQQLVVDFPIDMEKIGKVLQALGNIDIHPSVDAYFEVKDQTEMLKHARREALDAATATAHNMATQMGLKIVGLKTVQHAMSGRGSRHSLHVAYESDFLVKSSLSIPEIVPEEVSNTANVSVTWFAV